MITPQQRVWFLTPLPNAPELTAGGNLTGTVNGRVYTGTLGAVTQVAGPDGPALAVQGWLLLGMGGPTANRPKIGDIEFSQSLVGVEYIDTSLGYTIRGTAASPSAPSVGLWVNPATGANV